MQHKKETKLVSIGIQRVQREHIRKLAEKSGLKVYALIDAAVNLWAKTNGHEG